MTARPPCAAAPTFPGLCTPAVPGPGPEAAAGLARRFPSGAQGGGRGDQGPSPGGAPGASRPLRPRPEGSARSPPFLLAPALSRATSHSEATSHSRVTAPSLTGSRRHALPAQRHLSLSVAWGRGEPRSRGAAGDARPPATRPGPPESPAGLGRCARKRAASARTAALRGAAPGRGDPGASSGRISRSGTGTRLSSSQVTEPPAPPAPPPPTPRAEGSPWQHRLGDRDRVLFTDRTGGRGGSGGHSHPPHYQCGPLTRCLPHTAGMRRGHITVTLVQLYTSPAALYVTHTISGSPRAPPHAWEQRRGSPPGRAVGGPSCPTEVPAWRF